MVSKIATGPVQGEATRAAFRLLEIEDALTPKFEALITGLELVDNKSSSIRCQGQCGNGGRCSQIINKPQIRRSVLQLHIIALDGQIVGKELEEQLDMPYTGLLCGSANHCTPAQIAKCAARAKPVLEAWRKQWMVVPVVKREEHADGGCKKCVKLQQQLTDALADGDDLFEQRDQLQQQVDELTAYRTDTSEKIAAMRIKCVTIGNRREQAEERAEDLANQLQTLQIQHDGLLGRMASEVEQHQQSSRTGTPAGRYSQSSAASSSTFAFGDDEGHATPTQRLRHGRAAAAREDSQSTNEQIQYRFEPPAPPPSSRTLSPAPSPKPFSVAEKSPLDSHGAKFHSKPSPFAHLNAEAPVVTRLNSFFDNLFSSSSGAPAGMLGIGNTTAAGQRQPLKVNAARIPTPDATPEPKKEQKDSTIPFKSGPLQFPRASDQQQAQSTNGNTPVSKSKSKPSPRNGGPDFWRGGDMSVHRWDAPAGAEGNQAAVEEVKEEPFGFRVRRREQRKET